MCQYLCDNRLVHTIQYCPNLTDLLSHIPLELVGYEIEVVHDPFHPVVGKLHPLEIRFVLVLFVVDILGDLEVEINIPDDLPQLHPRTVYVEESGETVANSGHQYHCLVLFDLIRRLRTPFQLFLYRRHAIRAVLTENLIALVVYVKHIADVTKRKESIDKK